jgi:hypothetical protein
MMGKIFHEKTRENQGRLFGRIRPHPPPPPKKNPVGISADFIWQKKYEMVTEQRVKFERKYISLNGKIN